MWGGSNTAYARSDHRIETDIMCFEECFKTRFTGSLHLGKGWPAGHKITEQDGVSMFEPVEDLRKVLFERIAEAIH